MFNIPFVSIKNESGIIEAPVAQRLVHGTGRESHAIPALYYVVADLAASAGLFATSIIML